MAGSGGGTTPVNYIDVGPPEGEQEPLALLFVHGLSGCWQNWLEQIPHFARRHRVVALDLPGFGESPPPSWDVTIENYGRLLIAFCDAVGIRDCAVVGNSMGGFIAAETAVKEPGRFERLVLLAAAGVSSVRLERRRTRRIARAMEAARPIAARVQAGAFRRRRARARVFSGVFHHPERMRPELVWEIFSGENRGERFVEALTELTGYDILDKLEEVEVPTLIVQGRFDRIVPPRDALEYHRRLRNSRLEIFDDTGHLAMAERPVRFNRALEEFLAS